MYWAAARARGGRPRTGLFVPAAGRCRGSGAGHAPRWGCSWRVPLASVLDCVRCAGLRVWTQSLTRPVSCTARSSTGDSVGAPGLFDVDTDTASFGSEDAKPGSCACVRVLAPLGQVGRAGFLGAFLCASLCGLSRCSVCLLGPLQAWVPPLVLLLCFFFVFFSYVRPRCLWRSVLSSPGCLGPWRLVRPPPRFSWAVEWVVVCCCGRFVPAGAGLRLRCVALCPLVVPVLCVLLPVVLRVFGGAVLAPFLFPVLPPVSCLCALSSGLVLRCLRPVVALGCCARGALLRGVSLCCFALRWCLLCWPLWCGVLPRFGVPCGVARLALVCCALLFVFRRVCAGCAAPPAPPPAWL